MLSYAAYSPDATRLLAEKTGNAKQQVYIYVDPLDSARSFFLIPYPDKILHVSFSSLRYEPTRFSSLIDALYEAIYG